MLPGRLRLAAALAVAAAGCGPAREAEEPEEEPYRFIDPPAVSFHESLDIPLEVPDDPGELPLAEVVWKRPPPAAMALAGHLVMLVDDREGSVRAVDVRSGDRLWEASIPPCPMCAIRLTPAFDGERLVVSSGSTLFALDGADGTEVWRRELDGLPDGAATLLDGPVIVLRTLERRPGPPCGSITTRILFLDAVTGQTLWRLEYVGLFATFAVTGGFLHAVVSEGCDAAESPSSTGYSMRVYRLLDRQQTGQVEVAEPWAPPVVAAGRVFVQGAGILAAYEAGADEVLWSRKLDARTQSVVGTATDLYVAREDAVISLDPATAEVRWTRPLGDVTFRQGINALPTIAVSDDLMMLPAAPDPLRGYLVVIEPETGRVKRFFLGSGPVSQSLVWGHVGVVIAEDAVAALDLVREGTPERDLVPVGAAVRLLVDRLSGDLPFVPWEAAAREVERLGPEALTTLGELALGGSLVAGVIFASILTDHPAGEHVDTLVEILSLPPPGTDPSLGAVHDRLRWETIRALGAARDPAATGCLADLVHDEGSEPALRSAAFAALGELACGGSEAALAEIRGYRKARSAAAGDGWTPCPVPAGRFRFEGPFRVPVAGCGVDMETPFPSSESATSLGGEFIAYVSPALGGHSDVWLARWTGDELEGPWFTGVTVPGRIEVQYLGEQDDGTLLLETMERECEGCYLRDEDRPESGKPVQTPLLPERIARDSDGDGLTDLVEERLGTAPDREDTDGDGRRDADDPDPLVSRAAETERERILASAFFALLGFGHSSEPLYVLDGSDDRFTFEGYPAVVVHTDHEGALALHSRVGLPGPPMVEFHCPIDGKGGVHPDCTEAETVDPVEKIVSSEDGERASLSVSAYRSDADAALYRVELERVQGEWIVVRMELVIFG
jgi:outer membrane protein assembly factor BamB